MEEVQSGITRDILSCYTEEIVSDKLVILYRIETVCEYAKHENMYYPGTPQEGPLPFSYHELYSGTKNPSFGQEPYGFRIYCKVRRKITKRYADGDEKSLLEKVQINKLGENGKWINGLRLIGDFSGFVSTEVKEIEYTEERAAFFRKFLSMIFMVNDFVIENSTPDLLQKHIESQSMKLLSFI